MSLSKDTKEIPQFALGLGGTPAASTGTGP